MAVEINEISMAENKNPNVPDGQLRAGGEPAVVNPAVSGDANLLNGDEALEAVPIQRKTPFNPLRCYMDLRPGPLSILAAPVSNNLRQQEMRRLQHLKRPRINNPFPPLDSRAGVAQDSLKDKDASTYFSNLSAHALHSVIRDRIHNFSCDLWIVEDISGAAILAHVAPSTLAEFLQNTPKILSDFTRVRIVDIIFELIMQEPRGTLNLQQGSPSFLSEIQSTSTFALDDISTFTTNHHRATSAGASSSVNPFGLISITVNQPSATPPKYAILECCSDAVAFREWLRKNREESLLALPVDRRSYFYL